MISKRSQSRTKINITSQTAVSVYIRMFSDRFASLFHLSVLRKKLQIPRKGHQIRGCRFFSSSSQLRAKFEKKRATKQPNSAETSTPKPSEKVLISTPPPRTPPKSLQNSKKPLPGSPGCPRRVPERPWSVPGRSLEHPRSALGAPKSPPKRPKCVQGVSKGPSGHHFGSIWTSKWRSGSPFGHKKELRFPLQDHHLASKILCFTEGVRANVVRSRKGRRVSRSVPTRAHKRTAAHATTRRRKDAFRSCRFRCNVM